MRVVAAPPPHALDPPVLKGLMVWHLESSCPNLSSSPVKLNLSPQGMEAFFFRLQLHIRHHSAIILLLCPTRSRNALTIFPRPKFGPAKLYSRGILRNRHSDKKIWAWNLTFPSLGGVLISPFPPLALTLPSVLEDKEGKVMVCAWLAVDRQFFSSRLADLRSDHGLRSRDRAALCLPAVIRHLPYIHTGRWHQRQEEKAGHHPSHYTDALGCVTLNLWVWVHICSYFVSGR